MFPEVARVKPITFEWVEFLEAILMLAIPRLFAMTLPKLWSRFLNSRTVHDARGSAPAGFPIASASTPNI